jgi:glycosyltransferase involved in cell wall biosynthesis
MTTSAKSNGIATEPEDAASLAAGVASQITEIDESGLFDTAYYAHASGARGDRRELIQHYLAFGEAELVSPSEKFDVAFYLRTNPDVAAAGASALVHYLRFGVSEGRYPNRVQLKIDAAKIARSGLFDFHLFARQYAPSTVPGLSDIERYLTSRTENLIVSLDFDEAFYRSTYDDVRGYRAKPFVHYVEVGIHEARVAAPNELSSRTEACSAHFDSTYYLAQLPDDEKPTDPLEHYLLHGERAGYDPSPDFCRDYYSRRYADLGKTDPFYHFCLHGLREGRTGSLRFSDWFVAGERPFDLRKATVLIASHEASRTGAPLVGLNVVAKLSERYNVVVSLGAGGPLLNAFRKYACFYTISKPSALDAEYLLKELKDGYGIAAVLLNSVETGEYAVPALHAGVPTVALLHEFAEYTLPIGRMSTVVEAVDRVIVPSDLLLESLQRELRFTRSGPTNNVVVRPQGYLPRLLPGDGSTDLGREQILSLLGVSDAEQTHIVLGAGYVQMRKGIDLFVQTAAETRALWGDNVRFVWVGDGYEPTADLSYSAWVADMVRRLDLEEHVFFLPVQDSLDTLFALADVFYLPSRLDPFPNVVLDAYAAGKPVVCFERATGVADDIKAGDAYGAAVPYCNVREAAEALMRCMAPAALAAAGTNARLIEERYDFEEYVAFVDRQLEIAQAQRANVFATAQRIADSEQFDAEFHNGGEAGPTGGSAWRSILDYTTRGTKGLLRYNPRPGLNEGAYRSAVAKLGEFTGPALDPALNTGAASSNAPETHRCVVLDQRRARGPFAGRAALHLHLHYAELTEEYAERLTSAACPMDLFVTTTSTQKRLEIQYAFRNYSLGNVRVLDVPNRGRDIGPLLATAKVHLRAGGYDVIGHLHGKRSVDVDAAMGSRWRNYLVDTLIGDRANVRALLSLFEDDPKLGLAFAEDRHCVGWGKNQPLAEQLASELAPRPSVPAFPIFPLGTMFWARPAVLEPLWQRGYEASSFPIEPVPYDGSILHAIERLLPSITEATGHSWCTVYRRGSGW